MQLNVQLMDETIYSRGVNQTEAFENLSFENLKRPSFCIFEGGLSVKGDILIDCQTGRVETRV